MAFVLQQWATSTVSANIAAPTEFTYINTADTFATISAANYFSTVAYSLVIGDVIYVVASNAVGWLEVTAVNTAVNPATVSTSVITSGGTSVIAIATGTLTQANWTTMYTTPVSILAAPASGVVALVDSFVLDYHYSTAAFSGGGVIGLQYGATGALAGVAATAQISATFSTETASTFAIALAPTTLNAVASAANTALEISNQTAVFAGGNSAATFAWTLRYYTMAMT